MRPPVGTLDDDNVTVSIRCDRPLSFAYLKHEVILPLCSLINFATASRGAVKLAIFSSADDPKRFYNISGAWTGQLKYRPLWMTRPLFTAVQMVEQLDRPLERWAEIATTHRHALELFLRTPQDFGSANAVMDYMSLMSCLDSLLDFSSSKRFDDDLMNELIETVRKRLDNPFMEDIVIDIERLSRASRSNTLRSRLQSFIVSNCGVLNVKNAEEVDLDAALSQMIHTRVCAAHASTASCEQAAQGADLFHLINLTRLLINLKFLKLLGFDDVASAEFLRDSFYYGSTDYLEIYRREVVNR